MSAPRCLANYWQTDKGHVDLSYIRPVVDLLFEKLNWDVTYLNSGLNQQAEFTMWIC